MIKELFMAFLGYIVVVSLALLGSYFLLANAVGKEAANRNMGYALPWILVGVAIAFTPFLITIGGQLVWSFFYISYIVSIGVWLFSWPVRKRKAGSLLLDAGRTWHNKMLLWIGLAEVVVALVITWIMVTSPAGISDTSNVVVYIPLKIAFWWTLAMLIISLGLNKLELRENGLCFMYNAIPWQRMKSYCWEVTHPNTLTIRVRPRVVFLPHTMSIRVPQEHRDAMDRVLQTHIPFSPPDTLALS
ncbi:hypothetical protein U2F10_07090 [Leptothoe sp. EHU-05/26/07-4]